MKCRLRNNRIARAGICAFPDNEFIIQRRIYFIDQFTSCFYWFHYFFNPIKLNLFGRSAQQTFFRTRKFRTTNFASLNVLNRLFFKTYSINIFPKCPSEFKKWTLGSFAPFVKIYWRIIIIYWRKRSYLKHSRYWIIHNHISIILKIFNQFSNTAEARGSVIFTSSTKEN